jgi:hypothetical protein
VATTVAALALTCSTLMRRVQGATVMSYALVLFLLGGTFIAFGAQMLAEREGPRGRAQLILALNPLMATADVVGRTPENGTRVPSPFTPLQMLIGERTKPKESDGGWHATAVDSGVGFAPITNDMVVRAVPAGVPDPLLGQGVAAPLQQWRAPLLNRIPMWALSLFGYAALSFSGLALASRKLATPAAGER